MSRHLSRSTGLVITLGVAGSLFFGSAAAVAAPPVGGPGLGSQESPVVKPTPVLSSVDNFRDLAGLDAGYVGIGNKHLNRGVIYRSNALIANDSDLATLGTLGITKVYDLRTAGEITPGKEDRLPAGVTRTWLPTLAGDIAGQVSQLKTPADSVAFMENMNRTFVTDAEVRKSFTALFNDIAATSGAQVIHCTAGKDRTGWASAILQSLVGVSPQTIMSDYLLTNQYSAASIERQLAGVEAARGPEARALYSPLLHVEASYLQAGLDQLKASYGSVQNYLLNGLGLDPQTIRTLVVKLVG
ncbi:tyrosine-protein phosphatase [Nocardia sp. 348MFTsu5.1]|uniref:tyrosine-protein phosphatase n=1 Tax=Nocardia sp. 348MFTsu5.1 TaxID=1172185 RepID=UPI00039A08C6|nr:tyrosine-protein phosphatase [Nocardia sp. 348MFTsu5.1]